MSIQEMIGLLDSQKTLQEQILALSYEKRKVLLDNDTVSLNNIVQQEREHLSKIKKLEKKRNTLISQLAQEYGVDETEITVTRLSQLVPGQETDRLVQLSKALLPILEEQKELNIRNRELLEVHIDYTETILNMMMPSESLSHIYGGSGSTYGDEGKGPGLFDTNI